MFLRNEEHENIQKHFAASAVKCFFIINTGSSPQLRQVKSKVKKQKGDNQALVLTDAHSGRLWPNRDSRAGMMQRMPCYKDFCRGGAIKGLKKLLFWKIFLICSSDFVSAGEFAKNTRCRSCWKNDGWTLSLTEQTAGISKFIDEGQNRKNLLHTV